MFVYSQFKNPPAEYRSAPFWSWNGRLEESELRRQIRRMHEQGMGGFFMHPRGGMRDEYMGAAYMEAVGICVDEAHKLGMKAWLYDEDRFPSGGAGGLLTKAGPQYAAQALEMRVAPSADITRQEGRLRVFIEKNGLFSDITGMAESEIAALEQDVTVFTALPVGRSALWNNERYGDLLSAEAVAGFIELTHEQYKSAFGEAFGGVIPGIFTDEPSIHVRQKDKPRIPWTGALEETFRAKKGYGLLDNIYKLFHPSGGDYKKVRYDYWDVVSALFAEAFTAQLGRWCAENNLKFTGHFWEHVFPDPSFTGSVMPNYAYMQYPGIDMLFNIEDNKEQFNVLFVKELSSVKNQYGKERAISETHGASGWELNFADQKRYLDWQFVLGVDFVCQHLAHYSLEGYRKRDFPLSFPDEPWWSEYKLLGDYIGRLSYIMAQGTAVADVLVLHPSLSTYAAFDHTGLNAELEGIAASAHWLTKALCEIRFYYDLGDEVIMEDIASAEGASLRVGKMTYTTVILPSMTVMKRSTFELLKAFAGNGGHILAVGDTPYMLEGAPSGELKAFFEGPAAERLSPDKAQLAERLSALGCRGRAMTEENGHDLSDIYCCERVMGKHTALFVTNINRTGTVSVRMPLDGRAFVERLDCFTGERAAAPLERGEDGPFIRLTLNPVESCLLMLDYTRPSSYSAAPAANRLIDEHTVRIAADRFEVSRAHPNALTIQTVRYRINGGAWSEDTNVVAAFDAVRDAMGLERGNIFMRQPWMLTEEDYKKTVALEAAYTFNTDFRPERMAVVLERPDICEVFINGAPIAPNGGHYISREFWTYDIAPRVTPGENTIELRCAAFDIDSVLESVYVIGDFAVINDDGAFVLSKEGRIPAGDWTEAGYPFYSGEMAYSASFEAEAAERVTLSLTGLNGLAAVSVNGQRAGTLAFPPYAADITAFTRPGRNHIEIRVMNSMQNLLGPHDARSKGLVTPGSFYLQGEPTYFDKSGFCGECVITMA